MKLVLLALAAPVISGLALHKADTDGACASHDFGAMALLSVKATQMGVDCEKMCKRVGVYPNCQCPGFAGMPASDGDMRGCAEKYCQDPATPCPTDNFVACVKENTAVSALQWAAVMSRLGSGLDSLVQMHRLSKNETAGNSSGPAKAPAQGYEGKTVHHADQETSTGDWLEEGGWEESREVKLQKQVKANELAAKNAAAHANTHAHKEAQEARDQAREDAADAAAAAADAAEAHAKAVAKAEAAERKERSLGSRAASLAFLVPASALALFVSM